jgi:hypothetical protein
MELKDLQSLPTPEAKGRYHKPIHPATVVETLISSLNGYDHEVARTAFAMNPKETQLFGILDLEPQHPELGRTWSVGFMSSVDMTSSFKLAGGAGIFVCENFQVSGEVVVMRKHTIGLDLNEEIKRMTGKVLEVCESNEKLIEAQDSISLDDKDAFSLLGDALVQNLLPAAKVREAGELYMAAEYEDCKPRTLWGMHNAFTREIQKLSPGRRVPVTVDTGKFFRDRTPVIEVPEPLEV